MIRQLDLGATIATAILLLMVLWAPIPFASVLPAERGALQLAAFVALAALACSGRGVLTALRPAAAPAATLVAVGVLGLFQAMTLPGGLVALLSPASVRVWATAQTTLGEAGGMAAVSLAPVVSRTTSLQWLAVAATLLVATYVGEYRGARRLIGGALVLGAVFQVVYGAEHWFRRANTIWGVEVPGDVGRLRGTFVNPDHLALYLAFSVALCVGAVWWAVRRQRLELSMERRLLFASPPVMLLGMVFIGLSFTGSRAGLVATVLAVLAQTGLLAYHYRSGKMLLFGSGGLLLGFVGIGFFGWRAGLGRWLETSAYDVAWNGRQVAFRGALELWRDFPWLGTGLGTFRQAMPLVQDGGVEGTWTHAHCDYLELLATTGVVGLPLVLYGALRIGMRFLVVLRSGRRSEDRGGALAALGALVAAALASMVDFSLTIPANAITLATICGLACGTPTGRRKSQRKRTSPGRAASPARVRHSSQEGLSVRAVTGTVTMPPA